MTELAAQTAELAYGSTDLTLSIPKLNPETAIVSVPQGDQIEISAFGQTYIVEVRDSASLRPTDTHVAFASSQYDLLTLITCEGFDARTGEHLARRVVTTVLVNVRRTERGVVCMPTQFELWWLWLCANQVGDVIAFQKISIRPGNGWLLPASR